MTEFKESAWPLMVTNVRPLEGGQVYTLCGRSRVASPGGLPDLAAVVHPSRRHVVSSPVPAAAPDRLVVLRERQLTLALDKVPHSHSPITRACDQPWGAWVELCR